jgi:hypothetical protein
LSLMVRIRSPSPLGFVFCILALDFVFPTG